MRARARWHGVVLMVVMAVVMGMGMLMLHCLMHMLMFVCLGEMQHNTCQHQGTTRPKEQPCSPFT